MMTYARVSSIGIALALGGLSLFWSGHIAPPSGKFMSDAEARIGRPASPMSYAGVARRTTRRSAAYGAAAGAAAAGAYYASPGCAQAVNSYGQVVYRCP